MVKYRTLDATDTPRAVLVNGVATWRIPASVPPHRGDYFYDAHLRGGRLRVYDGKLWIAT